jgi:transposase
MGQFGVGEMSAVTILAELGDARRFSSSRGAIRNAGTEQRLELPGLPLRRC